MKPLPHNADLLGLAPRQPHLLSVDHDDKIAGIGERRVRIQHRSKSGRTHDFNVQYEGVIPHVR